MTKEVKPETEEVKPEGTTRDTTLGELGLSLPIFTEGNDNDPARAFSFKEWDMDTEEAISDMQNNCENVGEFVEK